GQDLDGGILLDRIGEVCQTSVDHHRHGLLGERFGNALSERLAGDSSGKGPLGTVGKCQGDVAHALLLSLAAYQAGKGEVLRGPREPTRERAWAPARAGLSRWHCASGVRARLPHCGRWTCFDGTKSPAGTGSFCPPAARLDRAGACLRLDPPALRPAPQSKGGKPLSNRLPGRTPG